MKKYDATILVVDGDAGDRMFMERAFRKLGIKGAIHLVASGDEAIAYMKGEGRYADRKEFAYPSFILTDLKMTSGDGFAVLAFLKRNPDWAIIPTVVISGSASPQDIKEVYRLGASSFHIKPIANEDLVKLLSILHDYWMTCEVPEVDVNGKQLQTGSRQESLDEWSPASAAAPGSKPT
jgi:CheY-like chemotaxis protein